jgi:hypothetical protein
LWMVCKCFTLAVLMLLFPHNTRCLVAWFRV